MSALGFTYQGNTAEKLLTDKTWYAQNLGYAYLPVAPILMKKAGKLYQLFVRCSLSITKTHYFLYEHGQIFGFLY